MLPEKFKERMRAILGDEYPKFERALTEDAPVRAFRINKIKLKGDVPEQISALGEAPVPYAENSFILKENERIGYSAAHHSGALYVQDPGAMATLAAIDVKKGIWAADLCAAPGGKTSKIAELIGDDGFLLANEYVPKRAKLLVGNIERLGIKNTVVTSLDTAELSRLFDGVFDLVVADVPCSGEGMFRKSEEALSEWSEENVRMCASRQREILENAARLLKPGGTLVYSTCTFSLEENEENVIDFIDRHPDFKLTPVHERLLPYTSPAINTDGAHGAISVSARRFYPHVSKGEGQFVAVLKKLDTAPVGRGILFKEKLTPPSKEECRIAEEFFAAYLKERPSGRLAKQGENIVLISHGGILPPKSLFCAGVLVGEIRKGILFPAHQFFSAFGNLFKTVVDLSDGDPRLKKYLEGEEISADGNLKGWCAVTYCAAALGGAKASSGILKNHYPKGLRNKP